MTTIFWAYQLTCRWPNINGTYYAAFLGKVDKGIMASMKMLLYYDHVPSYTSRTGRITIQDHTRLVLRSNQITLRHLKNVSRANGLESWQRRIKDKKKRNRYFGNTLQKQIV